MSAATVIPQKTEVLYDGHREVVVVIRLEDGDTLIVLCANESSVQAMLWPNAWAPQWFDIQHGFILGSEGVCKAIADAVLSAPVVWDGAA